MSKKLHSLYTQLNLQANAFKQSNFKRRSLLIIWNQATRRLRIMKKAYLLMQNRDYEHKPDESSGWFNLGSILTNPMVPESLLEGYSILGPHSDMPIKHSWDQGYKNEFEEHKITKYTIFAHFLELLGKINASYGHKSSRTGAVDIERLEAYFITPTKAYLEEVLNTMVVQNYLLEKRFSNLHIVTGIRVATQASGWEKVEKGCTYNLGAEFDTLALVGAPGITSTGPELQHTIESMAARSYEKSSDYIYAYRLAEIHYSQRKNEPILKDVKGEIYSLRQSKGGPLEDEKSELPKHDIKFRAQIRDEWVSADALPSRAIDVFLVQDDDGEVCEVIRSKIPRI